MRGPDYYEKKYPGCALLVWMCENAHPELYDRVISEARYEGVTPEQVVEYEKETLSRYPPGMRDVFYPQVCHPDYLSYVKSRLAVN